MDGDQAENNQGHAKQKPKGPVWSRDAAPAALTDSSQSWDLAVVGNQVCDKGQWFKSQIKPESSQVSLSVLRTTSSPRRLCVSQASQGAHCYHSSSTFSPPHLTVLVRPPESCPKLRNVCSAHTHTQKLQKINDKKKKKNPICINQNSQNDLMVEIVSHAAKVFT